MEIRNWLMTAVLVVLVPAWIGNIWSYFAGLQGKVKNLLFCWVSGFLTVMAGSQLILVPLVLRRYRFEYYLKFAIVLDLLLIAAAFFFYRKRKTALKNAAEKAKVAEQETVLEAEKGISTVKSSGTGWNVWQILFLTGALVLIFIQAFVAGVFQHIDDDDSRFVVEQLLAVEQNNMYNEHTVTGKLIYWNVGETRKDMISPWAMQVAFWCKLSGIAPAILSHKYLPFFLILLCYAVYALIGMHFFGKDREKLGIFLIFAGALNLFGYFSTHTTQAVMLLRIWQGKALVGAMLLPAMCYLMFEIMSREKKKMWYFLAAVCAMAAALASGSGITVMPLLIGAFGAAEFIHTRKIKQAFLIWCTAIPSVVYLLCYLFYWQILKIYY